MELKENSELRLVTKRNFWMGLLTVLLAGVIRLQAAATPEVIPVQQGEVKIWPVDHASLVMQGQKTTIYVDPVGGAERYADLPRPDMILITHQHGDHFDVNTLKALVSGSIPIVAPAAVVSEMPAELKERAMVLANDQSTNLNGVLIEAVPAYNLTAERLKYHPKGKGNGYVLTLGGDRFYISGDTEDIPEMRALKNIKAAFVCMNLPYTMTPDKAASAVLAFHPNIVYPYHHRGSDLELFKKLVGANPYIDVRLKKWYP